MKKNVMRAIVLGMLAFGGTAYATGMLVEKPTHCNAGTAGLCDDDVNGGKSCKSIAPGYLGDCGGTSYDTITN